MNSDMGMQNDIDETPAAPHSGPHQTADYVARMAAELRAISAKAGLGFLAYLLGMVEEEAARQGAARQKS